MKEERGWRENQRVPSVLEPLLSLMGNVTGKGASVSQLDLESRDWNQPVLGLNYLHPFMGV